jgi:hypothetical protein
MTATAKGPVRQNRGVEHLATADAFPGIEGTNEIIVFLANHAALAARTLHKQTLPFLNHVKSNRLHISASVPICIFIIYMPLAGIHFLH